MAEVVPDGAGSSGQSSKISPTLAKDVQGILEGLDTGDLVLFDRPCLKMRGLFGAAICTAAKVVGGSPFDHVGVVVRDESGSNVLVEASFSGVAVRPLCERIRRSSATQICVRRLQASRTDEMRKEARNFVSDVARVPYKEGGEGLLQMASAALRLHPGRERRRRVHAESVALSTSIARWERELVSQVEADSAPVAEQRLRRAVSQRRKAMTFLQRAATKRPGSPETADGAQQAAGAGVGTVQSSTTPPLALSTASSTLAAAQPSQYDGGLFCSELVAALYQRLGLLDAPFPKRHDYTPADFAQSLERSTHSVGCPEDKGTIPQRSDPDGTTRVALLQGAALSRGYWVKGGPCASAPSPSPPPDGGSGQGQVPWQDGRVSFSVSRPTASTRRSEEPRNAWQAYCPPGAYMGGRVISRGSRCLTHTDSAACHTGLVGRTARVEADACVNLSPLRWGCWGPASEKLVPVAIGSAFVALKVAKRTQRNLNVEALCPMMFIGITAGVCWISRDGMQAFHHA